MFMRQPRNCAAIALKVGLALMGFALTGVSARAGDDQPVAAPRSADAAKKKADALAAPRDSAARSIAKKIGIATDAGAPADFVVEARPTVEPDYIPIGRKEFEHSDKVKTPAELKAMEADFDAVKVRHDALRSTFAPARKAVEEAHAAQAAKAAKPKKPHPAPAAVE
jgi:hypothetical protein